MIVIADSGSTKTDWRILFQSGEFSSFRTVGLNPFYTAEPDIIDIVNAAFANVDKNAVRHLFFYGAGCAAEEKCNALKLLLNHIFRQASIEVEPDMLGTARALFSNKKGIAAILGTGSNTCLYDGQKIIRNVPSLGYILGDEGSGSYLGKKLITAYLRNNLSESLQENFREKYSVSYAGMLEHIYKKPFPNRWLASFSVFLKDNIHDLFIIQLVKNCFADFFDFQLCKYEDYSNVSVGISGSVAFHFSEFIREVAKEKNINIVKIIESPIDGLSLYHLAEE